MQSNRFTFRVHWGDTDAAGIVFYPNFFKWQDICSHEFFRSIGQLTEAQKRKDLLGWPIVEAKCVFKRPLNFDDEVTVLTTVEEIGNKSIRFSHKFYKNDAEVAGGYEVRVCTIFEAGKLPYGIKIPEDIVEALKGM